jgi:hypothetical protein
MHTEYAPRERRARWLLLTLVVFRGARRWAAHSLSLLCCVLLRGATSPRGFLLQDAECVKSDTVAALMTFDSLVPTPFESGEAPPHAPRVGCTH